MTEQYLDHFDNLDTWETDDYETAEEVVDSIANDIVLRPLDSTSRSGGRQAITIAPYRRLLSNQANVTKTTRQNRLVHIRNNAMIRLLIYTGLRRLELVSLRWSNVDTEKRFNCVRGGPVASAERLVRSRRDCH